MNKRAVFSKPDCSLQTPGTGESDVLDVKALLQVMAGAVIISFSAVFVHLVDVPPSVSAFYRVAFGAMALFAAALWRREVCLPTPAVLLVVCGAGVFFAFDLECWHRSIGYVGPGLATILGNFQVFFMAFAGVVLFGEALSLRLLAALPLAVCGLWLLVGVDVDNLGQGMGMGVILGLLTAIWYTGYILLLRRTQHMERRMPIVLNMALVSLCSAGVSGAGLLVQGGSFAIGFGADAVYLLGYGVLCQGIGWLLLSSGLPALPASVAGLIMLVQPTFSFVWDIVFFGRPTGSLGVLGATIAIGAIWMGLSGQNAVQRKRARRIRQQA